MLEGFPPALAGRFEPRRVVGRGGFATVFEALERASGRRVAVKLLSADLDDDPSLRDRFRLEAELAGRTVHPALVAVVGAGEVDGRLWLALEFVEGRTLRAVLDERRPLPWREAADLAASVADALGALHQAGIVHRDVKPENVMVQVDGAVRLLDLGIARLLDEQRQLTRTGLILGTPAYLAPELCRGEKAGPAVDVFATALLLLEALSPRPPVVDRPAPLFLAARAAGTESLPLPPGLPSGLATLLRRALADDPSGRPADGTALAGDLRRAAQGTVRAEPTRALSAVHTDMRSAVRPRAPRRRRLVLPAVALSLLAAVGVRWALEAPIGGAAAAAPGPGGPAAPDLGRAVRAYHAEVSKLTSDGATAALHDKLVHPRAPLTSRLCLEACRGAVEQLREEVRDCRSLGDLGALGTRFVVAARLAQALSTGPAAMAGEDDAALALAEAEMVFFERFDSRGERMGRVTDAPSDGVRDYVARGKEWLAAQAQRREFIGRIDSTWERAATLGQLSPAQGTARSRALATLITLAEHGRALASAEAAMASCWPGARAAGSPGAPTLAAATVARAHALGKLNRFEEAEAELRRAAALAAPWPRPGLTPVLELFVKVHGELIRRSFLEGTEAAAARGLRLARSLLERPPTPEALEAASRCLEDLALDHSAPCTPLQRLLEELRPASGAAAPGMWLPAVDAATARIVAALMRQRVSTPARADLEALGAEVPALLEEVLRLVPGRPEPPEAGGAELLGFVRYAQDFVEGFAPAEDRMTGDAVARAKAALKKDPTSTVAMVASIKASLDDRPLTDEFLTIALDRWEAATADRASGTHPALLLLKATVLTRANRPELAVEVAEGAFLRCERLRPAPGTPFDLISLACRIEKATALARAKDLPALRLSLDAVDDGVLARPPGPLPLGLQRVFFPHRELVRLLLTDFESSDPARARDRAVEVVRRWRGRGVDAELYDQFRGMAFDPAALAALRAAHDEPAR